MDKSVSWEDSWLCTTNPPSYWELISLNNFTNYNGMLRRHKNVPGEVHWNCLWPRHSCGKEERHQNSWQGVKMSTNGMYIKSLTIVSGLAQRNHRASTHLGRSKILGMYQSGSYLWHFPLAGLKSYSVSFLVQ